MSQDRFGTETATKRQEEAATLRARANDWAIAEVLKHTDVSAYNGARRPGARPAGAAARGVRALLGDVREGHGAARDSDGAARHLVTARPWDGADPRHVRVDGERHERAAPAGEAPKDGPAWTAARRRDAALRVDERLVYGSRGRGDADDETALRSGRRGRYRRLFSGSGPTDTPPSAR